MPAKVKSKNPSVGANVLNKMAEAGVDSVVLQQRQRYAVASQAKNQYIKPLSNCRDCNHSEEEHEYLGVVDVEVETLAPMDGWKGGAEAYRTYCSVKKCECLSFARRERSYPHFLPTQSNGRWSTTDPPITNFPRGCLRHDCPHRVPGQAHAPLSGECWDAHRVYKPDEGWYWLTWDKDAIEARINAVLTEDEPLIQAFMEGQDVHTLTACATFGLPLPSNVYDPHSSPECLDWRQEVKWGGKDDLRRRLAKVVRFGCFYGPDETAILGAKGVEELGLARDELLDRTKVYLASQPKLQKTKEKRWDEYIRNPEARTVWGRRLRCYPTYSEKETWIKSLRLYHAGRGSMRPGDAQKTLWNFEHSGAVSDHINGTIIAVKARWPECHLVFNKHDALTIAFPEYINPYPEIREIDEVEVTWPNGLKIKLTSTWQRIMSNGDIEKLR